MGYRACTSLPLWFLCHYVFLIGNGVAHSGKKVCQKKVAQQRFRCQKGQKKANFGLFLILTIISSLIKLELLFSCKLLYLNIIKKRKIFSFDIFFSREKKWAKKVIFSHFYFFFNLNCILYNSLVIGRTLKLSQKLPTSIIFNLRPYKSL